MKQVEHYKLHYIAKIIIKQSREGDERSSKYVLCEWRGWDEITLRHLLDRVVFV